MNRLAIILLNWNSPSDSIECFKSLQSQNIPLDIVIVDNHSQDDSVAQFTKLVAEYSTVHLIVNDRNLGFAGGINTGLRHALSKGYEYIGVLNPDAVADEKWASSILHQLDTQERSGIGAGLLLRRDGQTIDSTGESLSKWGLAFPHNRDDIVTRAPQKSQAVFGATGGSVIYKAEMLRKIGLFDEVFFMYYEDVDLSFRAQLAGYTAWYMPEAIAYHKQGASTNKVPGLARYQTFKNMPMLVLKNTPLGLWWTIVPRFALAYLLVFINAIIHGGGWSALRGLVGFLTLIPHCVREREQIQKTKIVSDDYIRSILWDDLPPEQTGLRRFRALFTGKS